MPDGTTAGVYTANLDAGTEVSSTYEGRHVTMLASELSGPNATIVKGDPVFMAAGTGDFVGVAFTSESVGSDYISVDTEGIWNLSVIALDAWGVGVAIVPGDALYINLTDGTGTISRNHDPEGNTPFGYALGSISSGNTAVIAVKVHWAPHEDYVAWGSVVNYTSAVSTSRWSVHSDYTGTAGHVVIEARQTCSTGSTDRPNVRAQYNQLTFTGTQTTGGGWQIINGVTGIAHITGTLYGSTTFVAGLYGGVSSAGTLTEVAHMCAIWGDVSVAEEPTTGQLEVLYLTNNSTGRLDQMVYMYGNSGASSGGAEYIWNFESLYFGGAVNTPIRDGGLVDLDISTGGVWRKIQINIDGTPFWLVAMENPTAH